MTEPIPVTKLEKDLTFPTLDLRFSESAARLEDLKKTSVAGVRLDPPLSGKWMWANDQHLFFKQAEDWTADQKFKIIFDKKFFPPHVLVERRVYEFTTPPFEIAIKDLQLYQDPANPTQRQITATLELTHAIEPGELDRHLQLLMIGGSTIFPPNDPAPHFALTYGLHKRIAYLRSSNVTLPEKEDFLKLELSKGVRTAQGGAKTSQATEDKLRIPSSKPSESNSRLRPRKRHKIGNTLLKYGWNRKVSFMCGSQKECAPPVIILWRRTTTRSLRCHNFRAKCRSKVKAVCWR